MAGTAGSIPKFGEWKASDGGSPYTMYFENARKRRNNSGITPPPGASPARMVSAPAGHRTPPRTADAKPVKPQDRANRSRNQAKAGQGGSGSVPTWGQWNQSNSTAGAQQYTLVFDQLRRKGRVLLQRLVLSNYNFLLRIEPPIMIFMTMHPRDLNAVDCFESK